MTSGGYGEVSAGASRAGIGLWSRCPQPVSTPGAAGLDVERGAFRALREIEAGEQSEPARHEVAKADAARSDRAGIAERLVPAAPRAAAADEGEQRPAWRRVPAQLELRGEGAPVLVARHRHAAQLDERQLVERHVAVRAARIGLRAEDEFPAEGQVAEGLSAVGLVLGVAAPLRRVEDSLEASLPSGAGAEEVVARIVLERAAEAGARDVAR